MPCNCGTLLKTRYNSTFYVFNWKLYLFDKTTVKDFGGKAAMYFRSDNFCNNSKKMRL